MSKKIEVEVQKEVHDIGLAIKKLIEVAVKALDDGWQPAQDIPTVMFGAYKEVMEAFAGFDKVADEFKAEPVDAANGLLIPVTEGVEILINRKKPGTIPGAAVVGNKEADKK